MSKQLDLFIEIHNPEKSAYWNWFYGPSIRRIQEKKKQNQSKGDTYISIRTGEELPISKLITKNDN